MDRHTIFDNIYVKLLILSIALLYSIYEYSWGIYFPDNYYWIHISNNWENSPMTMLSLWSMDEWHSLFGRTLLAHRALAWIINTLIVLLTYFIFISKKQRNTYWYFLCGSFVIMGPGIAKTCTPDCHSSLLILILLWCSLNYVSLKFNKQWLIAMGFLTALVIAARFPNIVCVPFVMLFLLLTANKKKIGITFAVCYLLLSLFIYWGLMSIAMGTTDVFGEIIDAFHRAAGSSNGRHSMVGLLLRYGKSVLLSMVACAILGGAWLTINRLNGKPALVRFIFPTLCSTILLYEIFSNIGSGWHSWSVCLPSFVAIPLLYCAYKEWIVRNTDNTFPMLLVVAMMFVPSAGSDTGFQKSMILACALMPFAINKLVKHNVGLINIAILFIIVTLTSILIFNERALYHRFTSDIKPMKYILWEKWQVNKNKHLISSIESYFIKDSTIFYGTDAHFLYCVTNTRMPYNTFWMTKNDTTEINRAVEALKDSHRSVLVDLTKSDTILFANKGLRLHTEEIEFNVYRVPHSRFLSE